MRLPHAPPRTLCTRPGLFHDDADCLTILWALERPGRTKKDVWCTPSAIYGANTFFTTSVCLLAGHRPLHAPSFALATQLPCFPNQHITTAPATAPSPCFCAIPAVPPPRSAHSRPEPSSRTTIATDTELHHFHVVPPSRLPNPYVMARMLNRFVPPCRAGGKTFRPPPLLLVVLLVVPSAHSCGIDAKRVSESTNQLC